MPWHFWEGTSRLAYSPKSPSDKKHEIRSDPISADPSCPIPRKYYYYYYYYDYYYDYYDYYDYYYYYYYYCCYYYYH